MSTDKTNDKKLLPPGEPRNIPKPLTRTGFLESATVRRAKETWGFSRQHVRVLANVLENWNRPMPSATSVFDTDEIGYLDQLRELSRRVIKNNGTTYLPTGYGLAVMCALSVPGSFTLAAKCARMYSWLRKAYFASPSNPFARMAELENSLKFDSSTSLRLTALLNDLSVCGYPPSNHDGNLRLNIFPHIVDAADLWAKLESSLIPDAYPTPVRNSLIPASALVNRDGTYSAIAVCAEAVSDFEKANERALSDPEGAITAARAMIESSIKWIHHERGWDAPSKDGSTGRRLKLCLQKLSDDEDFDKPGIKQMLSGMETAINALDQARNSMGDSHGKSPGAPKANRRIAQLIIGLATSATVFLLANCEARQRP